MKQTEIEIRTLKSYMTEMWSLVEQQVRKSFTALLENDRDLAREIISREKSVNAQELAIDRECENFIALFTPVAIDLRFVLSLLKINNNLERIGDFAESIAQFVIHDQTGPLEPELAANLQLQQMFETVLGMMEKARTALAREDSRLASRVLSQDQVVDMIHHHALSVLATYLSAHPDRAVEVLGLHNSVRRIERMGDRLGNIAEDIVFYVDAKELRHNGHNLEGESAARAKKESK